MNRLNILDAVQYNNISGSLPHHKEIIKLHYTKIKLCKCIKKHDEISFKKSCIRQKKHLSTDADSSTDTTVGWTKNTPNPNFLNNEKIIPNAKTQKNLEICQN